MPDEDNAFCDSLGLDLFDDVTCTHEKTERDLFRTYCEFAEVNALSVFSVSHQNGKS